jgi:hypothetical protein
MRHDRTWQSRRLAPRRQIDLICAPYLTSAAGSVAMQNGGYSRLGQTNRYRGV